MIAEAAEAPKYGKNIKMVPPKVQAVSFNYPRKKQKKQDGSCSAVLLYCCDSS
jgi:hypothetical protein